MTSLLWLRRDLRVHDHPALDAARKRGGDVIPVFCLDDRLLHGRHASGPRTQFLLECLADLDRSLRALGSGLVVRRGIPERELPALARELGADRAEVTADAGPFARRRDGRVADALRETGCELRAHPGAFVVDELAAVRTASGRPYTVFTPFHRAWRRQPRRRVLAAPDELPALPRGLDQGHVPELPELGLRQEVEWPAKGGERAGRTAAERFLRSAVTRYAQERDAVTQASVSRLSPYLHFGAVSSRELESRLELDDGPQAFARQLCWRDFYAAVMLASPGNARHEHQAAYRGTVAWNDSPERLDAWCEGRTGFPLVDAGMRQLRAEGWMHNRARLAAGSFLTKDLGIDWRCGERWFMRLLIDGDECSNNGNWQWIASVGVDPQPPFRSIYNPARQQRRFDPDGEYVRRFVPELRAAPDRYLAEPWTMPDEVQRRSGCVIGRDYPDPIVDHALARRDALARYAAARRAGAAGPGPARVS